MMTMTILPRRIRRLAGAATCATLLAAATVPLAAGSASAAPVGSSPTTAAAPAAPSPLPDGAARHDAEELAIEGLDRSDARRGGEGGRVPSRPAHAAPPPPDPQPRRRRHRRGAPGRGDGAIGRRLGERRPRRKPPDHGGGTGGTVAASGRRRPPRRRGAGDRGSRRRARGPLAADGRSAGLADLLAHPLRR